MELAPLMMLSPLLLFVAYSDLRYMRIPNAISILAVLVFVASAFIIPVDNLLLRLVAAGMAFAIGFLGFSFRIVGGVT